MDGMIASISPQTTAVNLENADMDINSGIEFGSVIADLLSSGIEENNTLDTGQNVTPYMPTKDDSDIDWQSALQSIVAFLPTQNIQQSEIIMDVEDEAVSNLTNPVNFISENVNPVFSSNDNILNFLNVLPDQVNANPEVKNIASDAETEIQPDAKNIKISDLPNTKTNPIANFIQSDSSNFESTTKTDYIKTDFKSASVKELKQNDLTVANESPEIKPEIQQKSLESVSNIHSVYDRPISTYFKDDKVKNMDKTVTYVGKESDSVSILKDLPENKQVSNEFKKRNESQMSDHLKDSFIGQASGNQQVVNQTAEVQGKSFKTYHVLFDVNNQISSAVKENFMTGKNEFQLQLNPVQLGKVMIKIAVKDSRLIVEIAAQDAKSQSIISANSGELKTILNEQLGTPVTIEFNSRPEFNYYDGSQNQNSNRQQNESESEQSKQNKQQSEYTGDFISVLDSLGILKRV